MDFFLNSDVTANRENLPALRNETCLGTLQLSPVTRADHQLGTLPRELVCECQAQASRSAGDQDCLAVQRFAAAQAPIKSIACEAKACPGKCG